MATVKLKNISKTYEGRFEAVKNFSMSVNDGELIILFGPTGSGKSTLLRIIAGLEKETSGQIFIGEKNISDSSPEERNVAVIYQDSALYPKMTVYENLSFILKLKRYNPKVIKKRVKEAATMLGITEILNKMPEDINSSQKQKVILGRAIVRNSQIIIVDESTLYYDKDNMIEEMVALHKITKKTIFIAMQDKEKALKYDDARFVILKEGFIQQIGTKNDIYNTPKNVFVATLLSNPQVIFKDTKIIKDNESYYVKAIEKKILISKEELKLMIYENNIKKDIILGERDGKLYFFEKESERLLFTKN